MGGSAVLPFSTSPLPTLQLPKGLCVHLQRVAWEQGQQPSKKEDRVVFPLQLQLEHCRAW